MSDLINKAKRSYSESILEIVRIALMLRDGGVEPQFSNCTVRWLNRVNIKDYAGLGDAIIKVQEVAPETRDSGFVLDILGISMRGLEDTGQLGRDQAQRRLVDLARSLSLANTERMIEEDLRDPKNTPGNTNGGV